MKKLSLLLLLFSVLTGWAQKGIVNTGARMVIDNGAYVKVQGDNSTGYTNRSFGSKHGRIDLNGEMHLVGFFNNNTQGGEVFINRNGSGMVVFNGTSLQSIGGSRQIYFEGVRLINSQGVNLNVPITVDGSMVFSGGHLFANGNEISFSANANVAGVPDANSMLVLNDVSTVRKRFNTNNSFVFPIGTFDGVAEYSPVEINMLSGNYTGSAYVGVQVNDQKHSNNSNATDYIERYWNVFSSGINSFLSSVKFSYLNSDIVGTESQYSVLRYDGAFWGVVGAVNAATNRLDATVDEFGVFTAGGSYAVLPQLTWQAPVAIEEANENGKTINVAIENDIFSAALNVNNWSISGLPAGVSVLSVVKTSPTTAVIKLSGNRADDFDVNIELSLSVGNQEFVNLSSGVLVAENKVYIIADNDPEELSMSDDGSIIEGEEDGEIISVTLTGGTFAQVLNPSGWVGENMPVGVSLGAINRISSTLVQVVLSGNATEDYDVDMTNFKLTITDDDVNDYTGADFVLTTGVTFTAIDESMQISMSDGGSGIQESAEDGSVIVVTIEERTFAASLNPASWKLLNLPVGVSLSEVIRNSDTEVSIVLSGNRIKDYDSDITNVVLRIQPGQIVGVSSQIVVSSGVTFVAHNDTEYVYWSVDADGIEEGSENGEVVQVSVVGGTFAQTLNINNWSASNLPMGVVLGAINRIDHEFVEITLSGNRQVDFDTDITNISLTLAGSEIDDFSGVSIVSTNTITIAAIDDDEVLLASGGSFVEGQEDGGIIQVSLTGGTFVNAIDASLVIIENAPSGVSVGSVIRTNSQQVNVVLEGNATVDYDLDKLATLTFNASLIDDSNQDLTVGGIVFQAIVEEVLLALTDNGDLYEEEEDGKMLTITVQNDTFISPLALSEFAFSNFPKGVTASQVIRDSDTQVRIELAGNRTKDYDFDIIDAGVTINASQFEESDASLTNNMGWVFLATNDAEYMNFSASGSIIEGSEHGAQIQLALAGGTFADVLSVQAYSFGLLPPGVLVGSVEKLSATTAVITLQNNATADYDVDIVANQLIVQGSQIDDYDEATIQANGSVTFQAIVETQSLVLSTDDPLTEHNLDGAMLALELEGAFFITPLNIDNFILNDAPVGVSIETLTARNTHSINVQLAYDGTDFDVNYPSFSVQLLAVGSSIGEDIVSNAIAIEAVVEPGDIQINHSGLTEQNLNGAVVDIQLLADEFVDAVFDKARFILLNAPVGLTIETITYVSPTLATVQLAFTGQDFDVDYANFTLRITAMELVGNVDLVSNPLLITAIDDHEILTIDSPVEVNEGFENQTIIQLSIDGGQFNPNIAASHVSLDWLPSGVSVSGVQFVDAHHIVVDLQGNRTEDYDDVNQSTIQIQPQGYFDAQNQNLLSTQTITFQPYIESLICLVDTIPEDDLYQYELAFRLVDDWFTQSSIAPENIALQASFANLSIDEVVVTDSTTFSVVLNYTGGAFVADGSFTVSVDGAVLYGVVDLISLPIIVDHGLALNDINNQVRIFGVGSQLVVEQNGSECPGNISIIDLSGKVVYLQTIQDNPVSRIETYLPEGVYFVQFITAQGIRYKSKVELF